MSKIKILTACLKNPKRLIRIIGNKGLLNWIPDKTYLKLVYWGELDKKLSFNNPIFFNEKIQWLKVYDKNPDYPKYVDKYMVRNYIAEKIGNKYLISMIAVYENVEEIEWEKLPNKFVLKCTHGSHSNIICTDKNQLDIEKSKKMLNKWMLRSWYWFGREWPYKYVKPRIVCEEYLGEIAALPKDYKIMCFDGIPSIIQVHTKKINESPTIDFYDMNGNLLDIRKKGFPNSSIEKINMSEFAEMIRLSEILSVGIPYIRTDFYLINNKIYFGELTFYDSSGLIDFEPEESNKYLGNMIKLNKDGVNEYSNWR